MNKRKGDIKRAVNYALSRGYQLEMNAFEFLADSAKVQDIPELMRDIIRNKQAENPLEFLITKEDIQGFLLPTTSQEEGKSSSSLSRTVRSEVEVVRDPSSLIAPMDGNEGFRYLFRSRFNKLHKLVRQRPDSYKIQKISSLNKSVPNATFKIAGLVLDKNMRRGHTELTIDDDSGSITVFATEASSKKGGASSLLDQMIVADLVFSKRGSPIAKSIYPPDIPERKPTLSSEKVLVVLLSDIHVGSKYFLLKEFERLVAWLSGKLGDERIVKSIKYVIIAGDLVDGIGVYPEQKSELEITNVVDQYERLAQLLGQFPKDIRIIVTPGDHDLGRKALPQPSVPLEYCASLAAIRNVILLGNPSEVRLHGVNVLVYHGRSLTDVVASIPGLSFAEPSSAMKVLLRSRHLAPVYGSRSPLAPEPEDHLVIEHVPEIFHSGHLHTIGAEYYRGTLIVNSGTWQSQTRFQANIGITPVPGIVPIIDLSTLDVEFKSFNLQE